MDAASSPGPGALPSGVVTFLLTDVVGSTQLWETAPAAMNVALARHDRLVEELVRTHDGRLLKARGEGDSTFSVFGLPSQAVRAARAIQEALGVEPWPERSPITIRIALHTGQATEREGDYYGRTVNRAARLRSIAGPGEVLVSHATAELVADHLDDGLVLHRVGTRQLRDLERPETVYRLTTGDGSTGPADGWHRPDHPEIRYAQTTGGECVAYSVRGSGTPDILGFGAGAYLSIATLDDERHVARCEESLADLGRLLRFDRPGIGLSDAPEHGGTPTMEEWSIAGLAVLDAAEVERAVVLGAGWSAPSALWLAAHYPDRVAAVVLFNGFARLARADGYPEGIELSMIERFRDTVTSRTPSPDDAAGADVRFLMPSLADDTNFVRWWERSGQQSATPRVSHEYFSMLFGVDVRADLAAVAAPTLVMQRFGNRFVRPTHGHYLASHIRGSRYVELDGEDHFLFAGNTEEAVGEIAKFLDRSLPGPDGQAR
ncbi:MAG TPA: alpha/beta fold hydrolase [Acidimicrobiales bacterium]|nr:alpha/beta fold hydrolase [Acidimicrobiales bacterium]